MFVSVCACGWIMIRIKVGALVREAMITGVGKYLLNS